MTDTGDAKRGHPSTPTSLARGSSQRGRLLEQDNGNYYDWTNALNHPDVTTPGRTPLRLGPPKRTPVLSRGTRNLLAKNYTGSTRLQPFGSRAGHVNAFTQLPNVLSTEYWLRKSSTESKNGDLAAAISTLEEALQRNVRPTKPLMKALAALQNQTSERETDKALKGEQSARLSSFAFPCTTPPCPVPAFGQRDRMVQGQGGQGSNAGASGVADMEKPSGLLPPVSKRGSLNEAKEAETHDKLNLPERRKSQVRFATPEQNTLIPVSVLSPGTRGANSCNAGSTPYHSAPQNRKTAKEDEVTPISQSRQTQAGGELSTPGSASQPDEDPQSEILATISASLPLPSTPTMFKPGHQTTAQWLGLNNSWVAGPPPVGGDVEGMPDEGMAQNPALSVQINPMFNLTPSSVSSEEIMGRTPIQTPYISKPPPPMRKATPIGMPPNFKSFARRTHFLSPDNSAAMPRSRFAQPPKKGQLETAAHAAAPPLQATKTRSSTVLASRPTTTPPGGQEPEGGVPEKPAWAPLFTSAVAAAGLLQAINAAQRKHSPAVGEPLSSATSASPPFDAAGLQPLGSPIPFPSTSLPPGAGQPNEGNSSMQRDGTRASLQPTGVGGDGALKKLFVTPPPPKASMYRVVSGDAGCGQEALGSPIPFITSPPGSKQEHLPLASSLGFGSPMPIRGSPCTPAARITSPVKPPTVPHVPPLTAPPTPVDNTTPALPPSPPEIAALASCAPVSASSTSTSSNLLPNCALAQQALEISHLEPEAPCAPSDLAPYFSELQIQDLQDAVSQPFHSSSCHKALLAVGLDPTVGLDNFRGSLGSGPPGASEKTATGSSDGQAELEGPGTLPSGPRLCGSWTPLPVGKPVRIAGSPARSAIAGKEVRAILGNSPHKVNATNVLGSTVRLSPVRAPPKLRGVLGSSTVVTPVRRSARKSHAATPVSRLLRDTKYSYTPNVALEPHLPAELSQQLCECPHPPPPTPLEPAEAATEAGNPAGAQHWLKTTDPHFIVSLTNKLSNISMDTEPNNKSQASEDDGTHTPEARVVLAVGDQCLGTPETTVHALQPVSTPEEIPVELADRTNRMSAQPARRSSTGKVLTKLSVPAQKEEFPLDLSPTDARIRKGVRRSSRLHAAASGAVDPKQSRGAPIR